MIRSMWAAVAMTLCLLLAPAVPALAQELKVLSVIGIRAVMEDLGPQFEKASGHRLIISFGTSGDVIKQIEGGETADLVLIPRQAIERLRKGGKVVIGQPTFIASSGLGVAVKAGAAKPDISTPETFKQALLAAKTITYANPAHGAASGIHFAKMLDRLGISSEMRPKTVFLPKAGPVATLVAKGEAEMAIHQIQEMLPVAGIDIVGPLPGYLQETLVFEAASVGDTKRNAPSEALINFMQTPAAAKVIRAKGMEPVSK